MTLIRKKKIQCIAYEVVIGPVMWIDINKKQYFKGERGKKKWKTKLVVKGTEMEVVDGKVVISSEELAAAIQTKQIDLGGRGRS